MQKTKTDRERKQAATVYRYPVRFNAKQLEVASHLLASTGIANLSALVHFAFAQLAKTAVGSLQEPAPATAEPKTTGSDPGIGDGF